MQGVPYHLNSEWWFFVSALALFPQRTLLASLNSVDVSFLYSLHKSLTTEPQSSDEVNSLHPLKSTLSNNAEKEKRHLLEELAEERREKNEMQMELEKMESRVEESSREHERYMYKASFQMTYRNSLPCCFSELLV